MPTLSDMPDVVMDIVLQKVGLKSLMTLRKVSHNFRDYIDESLPDMNLESIQIIAHQREIKVFYVKEYRFEECRICYMQYENGCLVASEGRDHFLPNTDLFSVFFWEFSMILRHQKSILPTMYFSLSLHIPESEARFLYGIRAIVNQMKVKCVHIGLIGHTGFEYILPCFNADVIEEIELADTRYIHGHLELDSIMNMDHWRNARKISLQYFMIAIDLQNLIHCDTIVVQRMHNFLAKDLELLKKTALESPSFERYNIHYFNIEPNSTGSLGIPHSTEEEEKIWYFKTNRNKIWLKIVQHSSSDMIIFTSVDSTEIPKNVS